MDPKIIEKLLSELYQYAIIGGIIVLAGIMLKSFLTTIATNIWAKIISRSKITMPDTDVSLDDGKTWYKVISCGFNRVKLKKPNINEDGEINKDDPDLFTEMSLRNYWSSKVTYK